jgi:predicted CoA-binding protein
MTVAPVLETWGPDPLSPVEIDATHGRRDQMIPTKEAATRFLECKRIAVTGVSRDPKGHGSNAVYKRLRERGYEVFAVNPNADVVEGDPCFHRLQDIPGGVDAVVMATRSERVEETMRECVDLGITKAWMHRAFGDGSVNDEATRFGREHGVTVIDGGCPLMFEPTNDFGHKIVKLFCSRKIPQQV